MHDTALPDTCSETVNCKKTGLKNLFFYSWNLSQVVPVYITLSKRSVAPGRLVLTSKLLFLCGNVITTYHSPVICIMIHYHYWHCLHSMPSRVYVTVGVHSSLQAWAYSSKAAAAVLLLWVLRIGDADRLLQQWLANAGSATLSAYVGGWQLVRSKTMFWYHIWLDLFSHIFITFC